MEKSTITLIAHDWVRKGDILTQLWTRYCRVCLTSKDRVIGIALNGGHKGKKIKVMTGMVGVLSEPFSVDAFLTMEDK